MTQWEQVARLEGVTFKPVSLPTVRFTEAVGDPVRAFALLLGGRALWFKPNQQTLVEVVYKPPYFRIRTFVEGSPHLSVCWTPDLEKVIDLLRKYVAYLAE